MTRQLFSDDDFFVLQNLCCTAISAGKGQQVRKIIAFLQSERPDDATGFMMEALDLHAAGKTGEALARLEESNALDATTRRDDAMALYVVLTKASGAGNRAVAIGQKYLTECAPRSNAARYMIGSVLEDVAAGAT